MRPAPQYFRRIANVLLLLMLAGCAAGGRQTPVIAAAPASSAASPEELGTVAAVREVDSASGDGSRAGIDAVLAALGQPVANGPVGSMEIVVIQPDGSAVSLGGPYPGFAVGNRVTISAGESTALLHGG
jgi:hypothetical protein